MNLFEGLEELGLKDLNAEDLYAEHSKDKKAVINEQNKTLVTKEEDFIFDKTHTCPVCDKVFKAKTLRAAKSRMVSMDKDLKPNFDNIEPLKYDVVLCPECGYAATNKYYSALAPTQIKLIKEKISAYYKGKEDSSTIYTYEDAVGRYKLALACAMVKLSKASEKAYICLRAGWLARSYAKELEKLGSENSDKIAEIKAMEEEFLKKAYDGYLVALQQEMPPISGMDERTMDYLLGALACRFDDLDVSVKMVQKLLLNNETPKRIKDKALELKEDLRIKIKEKNNK